MKKILHDMRILRFQTLLVLQLAYQLAAAACLTTLNELSQAEEQVVDFSVRRTYELCPNINFIVGRYDYSYNLVEGQDPLIVRPNLHVKCGGNGDRSNQCVLSSGDILVTDAVTGGDKNHLHAPIILQGLTLVDPGRHFVKLTQPYDVRFVNCEFRQARRATAPLLLDFYDPTQMQAQLQVYWHGCDFLDNSFAGAEAQPSLMVATNQQVALSLHGCHFSNNDFVTENTIASRSSFLIDTSGPLELYRNCFSYNAVGVSPAVSYHADPNAALTLVENFAEVSQGNVCPFVSHFRTAWQYQTDSPFCHNFDVTSSCLVDTVSAYFVTDAPAIVPTAIPPTVSPTLVPTNESVPVSETPTESSTRLDAISSTGTPISPGVTTATPTTEATIEPTHSLAVVLTPVESSSASIVVSSTAAIIACVVLGLLVIIIHAY